jgi:hypothetical protein
MNHKIFYSSIYSTKWEDIIARFEEDLRHILAEVVELINLVGQLDGDIN